MVRQHRRLPQRLPVVILVRVSGWSLASQPRRQREELFGAEGNSRGGGRLLWSAWGKVGLVVLHHLLLDIVDEHLVSIRKRLEGFPILEVSPLVQGVHRCIKVPRLRSRSLRHVHVVARKQVESIAKIVQGFWGRGRGAATSCPGPLGTQVSLGYHVRGEVGVHHLVVHCLQELVDDRRISNRKPHIQDIRELVITESSAQRCVQFSCFSCKGKGPNLPQEVLEGENTGLSGIQFVG
mmetsp:Transcript_26707/g.61533  ORF Transcript_26707/g.61533 Transcript_26707/m.61533 type:complete len:237 (+) Transcript_26707:1608-2318(+)